LIIATIAVTLNAGEPTNEARVASYMTTRRERKWFVKEIQTDLTSERLLDEGEIVLISRQQLRVRE